jgi:hypothetical protein
VITSSEDSGVCLLAKSAPGPSAPWTTGRPTELADAEPAADAAGGGSGGGSGCDGSEPVTGDHIHPCRRWRQLRRRQQWRRRPCCCCSGGGAPRLRTPFRFHLRHLPSIRANNSAYTKTADPGQNPEKASPLNSARFRRLP